MCLAEWLPYTNAIMCACPPTTPLYCASNGRTYYGLCNFKCGMMNYPGLTVLHMGECIGSDLRGTQLMPETPVMQGPPVMPGTPIMQGTHVMPGSPVYRGLW